MPYSYLIDGVQVSRKRALITVLRDGLEKDVLDKYETTIFIGGADQNGKPVGEVVEVVWSEDKREERKLKRIWGAGRRSR